MRRRRACERRGRPPRWAVLSLVALASASPLAAQELRDGPGGEPPLEIPRLEGIQLDGVVGDEEWAAAVAIEGVMHLPDFGAEPTERTVFLIAHDDENLYFACRAYDSEPDQVRVTTLVRDISTFNTDACGIRLDPYNDEENSLLFNTTPEGVRTDWSFSNDASGGPPNTDWNAFWDAAGAFTEYGWSGEMTIPFSSLGFQVDDEGRVIMGFSAARSVVRKAETTIHPAIPPTWGQPSMAKPSQFRKMIMRGVRAAHPVYVTPYALGGGSYTHELNGAGDAWRRNSDRVTEVGLDVRYGLTRNLNLDVTVNTDFAQVEADDQQINLTRFSLFFPEKRRFFQERAAVFDVSLNFAERLFHSRRVGLVGGQPVRILGGARTVGRIGEWDVGFLDMQTDDHGSFAGENLGVLRLRRRVLNQFSNLGGLVTSRVGNDGSYNVLYGTDAVVRLFGQDYLTLNWSQSFDDADAPGAGPFDRSLVRFDWQRRGIDGLNYAAQMVRAGDVFEPGMGFLFRRDYLSGSGSLGYGWRPGSGSALNSYGVTASGNVFRRNSDGSIQSGLYGLSGQLQTRTGHGVSVLASRSYEDLRSPFPLSANAQVPVGSYRFSEARVGYSAPQGALIRPGVTFGLGEFYDGTRVSIGAIPEMSLSRHLTIGGAYELNRIRFGDRGQSFTSHLGRARTELTFSTATSTAAFVQYNSAGDVVVLNFRFRYNPSEGNDLYVVWNESLNSDRFAPSPMLPLSQERTLLVKYARTFTLGF